MMGYVYFLILVIFGTVNVHSIKDQQVHYSNSNLYELSCLTTYCNSIAAVDDREDLNFSELGKGTHNLSNIILKKEANPILVQNSYEFLSTLLDPLHIDIPPPACL